MAPEGTCFIACRTAGALGAEAASIVRCAGPHEAAFGHRRVEIDDAHSTGTFSVRAQRAPLADPSRPLPKRLCCRPECICGKSRAAPKAIIAITCHGALASTRTKIRRVF